MIRKLIEKFRKKKLVKSKKGAIVLDEKILEKGKEAIKEWERKNKKEYAKISATDFIDYFGGEKINKIFEEYKNYKDNPLRLRFMNSDVSIIYDKWIKTKKIPNYLIKEIWKNVKSYIKFKDRKNQKEYRIEQKEEKKRKKREEKRNRIIEKRVKEDIKYLVNYEPKRINKFLEEEEETNTKI